MRRRIAHRPRHWHVRYAPRSFPRSHKDFLATGWTYRRQSITLPKRIPGQSLLLVPWGYRLLQGAIVFAR